MKQTPKYVKEVQELLAQFDNDENSQDKQPLDTNTPEQETDVYIEDFDEEQRITLIRKKPYGKPITGQEEESELSDLDTQPLTTKPAVQPLTPEQERDEHTSKQLGLFMMSLFVFLCLSSIALQLHFILNPPIATIILIPKSQTISLNATMQLGRVLPPTTLSQAQTVPTTGKEHQDAIAATGSITFYNGQLQSVFVPAGTILVGNDGVQIITDQDATIPAANLPQVSQATISAHAMNTGASGNIAAYDISQGCCNGVKAVNTTSFSGGQDERNFQTVTKQDIANVASTLKTTLAQSMQGALTGQVQSGEALVTSPCTPKITTDHQIGQEATQVKVTVSETCSGVAYNTQELASRATQLLTPQAVKKLGTGYSMLGDVQVTTNTATVTGAHPIIAFTCNGVWVYALSDKAQAHIKDLIKGKTTQDALHLLQSLPGIERVSTSWDVNTKLPKDISYIQLLIFYGL